MKKYSVHISLYSGKKVQFESVDNPLELEPFNKNGAKMIMTKERYSIDLQQVAIMEVMEI